MDLYFITTLINTFWQIFSILFVLYRFTSFFSMIYNFFKFLGKLTRGFIFIKDKIQLYFTKRNGYSALNRNEIYNMPIQPVSTIKSFKTGCYNIYNRFFGKDEQPRMVPLYETTYQSTCSDTYFNEIHEQVIDIDNLNEQAIDIDNLNESIDIDNLNESIDIDNLNEQSIDNLDYMYSLDYSTSSIFQSRSEF